MSYSGTAENLKIVAFDVKDVRFPTSLQMHGSDAMHGDPDYSCAYVTITLKTGLQGHGLTFTCGRGTEIVVTAIKALQRHLVGLVVTDIFKDFSSFWRTLTSDSQVRWIGPEKGAVHLAVAAIVNALWDVWAKLLNKPVWQLLSEMDPEQLVSCIDFRYLGNALTKEEALNMLKKGQDGKMERLNNLLAKGYPAYTTQAGWIGYNKEYLIERANLALQQGFTAFKVKVGTNLYEDIKRLELIRRVVGDDKTLMVDANQVWEVQESIDWMRQLAHLNLLWIEEPTSPDDILGHAEIRRALKPLNIGVATGEQCCNRVMFKQFIQAEALDFLQIDSCRLGGVNEILSVYLMAQKFGVKVVPHAGGVGLCEMVQHLQMWDYVSLSGTSEGRYIEYANHHREHFVNPTNIENGHYLAPRTPGYNTTLRPEAIARFEFPNGSEWEDLFAKGVYHDPRTGKAF